jgi:hypothetical protein
MEDDPTMCDQRKYMEDAPEAQAEQLPKQSKKQGGGEEKRRKQVGKEQRVPANETGDEIEYAYEIVLVFYCYLTIPHRQLCATPHQKAQHRRAKTKITGR